MKPTKKKKNTYIVTQSVFVNLSLFSSCTSTPLVVVEVNGQKVQKNCDWPSCTNFPNPCTANMVSAFKHLRPIMGERLANTIVEYLDKETNQPVAMLFPTNELMYKQSAGNDFMSRLNHATRQDLKRQMNIREKLLMKVAKKQKQK